MMADDLWRDTYEQLCAQTAGSRHDPANLPAEFDLLPTAEQAALRYWVRKVFKPADRRSPFDSYGMKHHFEAEGFYVTNGAFKGAMVLEGFLPVDPDSLNWVFKVRTAARVSGTRYSLGRFDREFMRLLLATRTGGHVAERAGFRLVPSG